MADTIPFGSSQTQSQSPQTISFGDNSTQNNQPSTDLFGIQDSQQSPSEKIWSGAFSSPLQNIATGNSQKNLDTGKGAAKQAISDISSTGAQNAGPVGADMLSHAPAFAQDINALKEKTTPNNDAQKQGALNTSIAEVALPTPKAVGAATDVINPILESRKAANAVLDAKAVDNLAGKITQGTTADVNKAKSALTSIDTTGIKTYKDLSSVLGDKIKNISTKLDETLATNKTAKPLSDLTLSSKVGDSNVSHNYVQDAISQLKNHYQATNDVPALEKVKQLEAKASETGLTTQDVNNLAREHGQALNAFNANGQAASGLTKQAAENTRRGLKATAREMFDNPVFKASDSKLTDLIRTKDLVDNVGEKVNQLQQKIQERGLGEKAGRLLGQVVNLVGLNGPKGFIEYFLGRGTGLKTLNALDLEKMLSKNLGNLQEALKPEANAASVEARLQKIIDDTQSLKGDEPKINSQSLESASNGKPNTMQSTENASQNSIKSSSNPISPKSSTQRGFIRNPFAKSPEAPKVPQQSQIKAPASVSSSKPTMAPEVLQAFKGIHPDDIAFFKNAANKVMQGDSLKPQEWQRVQETFAHYGMETPNTQTRFADYFKMLYDNIPKAFNKTLDDSLKTSDRYLQSRVTKPAQGRTTKGLFDFLKK